MHFTRHFLFFLIVPWILISCTNAVPEVACLGDCNKAKSFEYALSDGSLNFKGQFIKNSEVKLYEDDIEIPIQPTFVDGQLKVVPIASAPRQLKSSAIYKIWVSSANASGTSTFTLPQSTTGGGGGASTSDAISGDVSGTMSASSVDKIKGVAVSTASMASGHVLKYNGTAWINSLLSTSDISGLSTTLGNVDTSITSLNTNLTNLTTAVGNKVAQSQLPTTCSAGSTLTVTSVSENLTCSPIAIAGSQVAYGNQNINTVFAGPSSGSAGSPSFRALTAADMPAGMTPQWTKTASDLSYTSGKVGIGIASPTSYLHVVSTGNVIANFDSSVAAAGGYGGIQFSASGASVGFIGYGSANQIFTNGEGANLQIKSNAKLQLGSYGTAALVLDGENVTVNGLTIGRGNGTGGETNSVFGKDALLSTTDSAATSLTAIGYRALRYNSSGSANTAVGSSSLANNTTGSSNLAVGRTSMSLNTTGSENTAIGTLSLYSNTTGGNNSAVGYKALYNNQIGSNNIAVGHNALAIANGNKNIAIGKDAGSTLTSETNIMILGGHTGAGVTSGTIVIADPNGVERMRFDSAGHLGVGLTLPSYELDVFGSARASGYMYATNFLTSSDKRFKRNIASVDNSLEKLKNISGVSYDWRINEFPEKHFQEGRQLGVLAQEVEKYFPEAVKTDTQGYKSVSYISLVAPIIEAIKELASNKADKTEIEKLRLENEQLRSRLDRLEKAIEKK